MVKPKDILTELAEQFLPQMTPSERREALRSLQGVIDAEFFKLAEEEAGKPEIAGRGPLTKARAMELLRDKLKVGAIISTDKARAYRDAERELELACHNAFDAGDHKINRINNVHSQLEGFMDGFYGVSSRRLENYLTWFKWEHSFKNGRTSQEMSELVVKQAVQGTYDTTWREYKSTPYPFWEYWKNHDAA